MELSIDTSTRYASVGLSREGQTIAEFTWRSEQNHSIELVPAVRELMRRAGVEMNQLGAIFVARGPGAFSALRVGMSTAKALAVALQVPLVSASSLDIEAQPYLELDMPVYAVINAGRDRFYLGTYDAQERPDGSPCEVVSGDELTSRIRPDTLYCGEAVQSIADVLRESCGGAVHMADVPPPTRRASVLAYLAYRRLQAGDRDDPATIQPLYLRSAQVNMARRTWAKS